MPPEIPIAEVVAVSRLGAVIRCPYCGREHAHDRNRVARGTLQHHHNAPACGMWRTPDERQAGYQFTTDPRY